MPLPFLQTELWRRVLGHCPTFFVVLAAQTCTEWLQIAQQAAATGCARDGRHKLVQDHSWLRVLGHMDGYLAQCEQMLKAHHDWVTCLAQWQTHLITGSDDGSIVVWSLESGIIEPSRELAMPASAPVNCIAVQSEKLLAASSMFAGGPIQFSTWDLHNGALLGRRTGDSLLTPDTQLADGRCIVGSNGGDVIRIREASPAQGESCVRELGAHNGMVVTCTADLGHGQLVSGGEDKMVRVWDIATGKCVQCLEGHTGWVKCVIALSNQKAASGSFDHTIRIWCLQRGVCLQQLNGHTGVVTSLLQLSDGRLISGSGDGTIRVWR